MIRRKLFKVLLVSGSIVAILLALGGIVFLIASHMANATRLPPELLQPSIGLELAPPEKSHSATPVTALPKDVLEKVNTLEDYLRACLARDRVNPAITLYLEVLKRYEDEGIKKKADDARIPYIHDKVNSQQVLFFREQADYIDILHQLAQAGTVPAPTAAEEQIIFQKNSAFHRSGDLFLLNAIPLLTSHALWRAIEGDYSACRRDLLDALRLVEQLPAWPGVIGQGTLNVSLMDIQIAVQSCIEKFNFPAVELPELALALEDAERKLLPPDRTRQELFESCWLERGPVVAAMGSGTWRRKEFGWIADVSPQYYWLEIPWGGRKFRLPRVIAYTRDAARAIHNRMKAPEALRNYDRFYRQAIESSERVINGQPDMADWSHIENYSSFILPLNANTARQVHDAMMSLGAGKYLVVSTSMHLCRLGVAWRLDPQKALAQRSEDSRNDPFHPWRDPYTGKTLQMIETTTQTMIYSLGEDRKDQGGNKKSDDILIHIPH